MKPVLEASSEAGSKYGHVTIHVDVSKTGIGNLFQKRDMDEMASDPDDFADAQRVSSLSPTPKRRCSREITPPLFSSLSSLESSSDGACFPSDESSHLSAVYPSEERDCDSSRNKEVGDALEKASSGSESFCDVASHDSESERELVGSLLVSKCCHRQCLLHLTALDVMAARRRYYSLKVNEQRQWLMDRILENSHEQEKGKRQVKFSLSGFEICQASWSRLYGVSSRRLSRLVKSVSDGVLVAEHGNKGRRRSNTKSNSAKAWMTKYFHLVGDKMPHNSQIHLPSWETQKDVYMRYTEDMTIQGIPAVEIVSLSMFYKIWAESFSNVVIPQVCLELYINECTSV